jgi:putative transposase
MYLVKLRYQFRFYPTPDQEQTLARVFGSCRFVYNWALQMRTDAYRNGERINYNASSAALTALKKQPDYEWLNEVSSVPTQQVLRHLQTAYRNFFDKRSGYPSFKKKRGKQSAEYTKSAFKWDARNRNLTVAQLGRLRIRWSREFVSDPTTVTITKLPDGRYFVTLVLDEPIEPLPKTGCSIGIDLGVSRLATLSNGERIANPRGLMKAQRKLAKAQRLLARKKPGSKRRERARLRVARLHSKVADARADYLHKFTTDLVRRFDVICIEDLNIRGMVRNHSLARSLSDASLGTVSRMLDYKCEWYGKELVKVDRWFPSSKTCQCCGYIVESLPLSIREWTCPECGAIHDRDWNAAINIEAVGHTDSENAQGGLVRRGSATAVSRKAL